MRLRRGEAALRRTLTGTLGRTDGQGWTRGVATAAAGVGMLGRWGSSTCSCRTAARCAPSPAPRREPLPGPPREKWETAGAPADVPIPPEVASAKTKRIAR